LQVSHPPIHKYGYSASKEIDVSETEEHLDNEIELGVAPDVDAALLAELRAEISSEDRLALIDRFNTLHVADTADIIVKLDSDSRHALMALIGNDLPAQVFAELDENTRDEVLQQIDIETLVATVQELDSDDAVFVLEDLATEAREEVLEQIPVSERLPLQRAFEFPEDSAGRLMQAAFVAVPPFWSVGQTIDYLRDTEDLPTQFLEIFITNETHQPVGVVQLSEVLRAQRPRNMSELAKEDFHLIPAELDREEVARLFERYNLVSAAVTDEDRRLIGVITADDVYEVMSEEAGEDILLLGGVGDETVSDSVLEAARGRLSWLFLNLLTAIAASIVIGFFDGSIEQMVALAVLMPIVASMGGNAGTQTLTITVRSLATQELSAVNMMRSIYRELGIGFVNGLFFAIVTGIVGALWFDDIRLGVVLAAAMIVNLVVAALAGILIPLGLQRADIDPAVSSTVFVTTVTDIIGFLAFLGFATIFLL
jgi:magnesium transporter